MHRVWRGMAGGCALGAILLAAAGTAAPTGGAAEHTGGELSEGVVGTLRDPDGDPVAGVQIEVRRDGESIGEDVTGDDGTFRIPVPEPGVYEVELVVDTVPDELVLRHPDRAALDNVLVSAGRDRTVGFPFGELGRGAAADVAGNRVANTMWNGLKFGLVIALASIGLSLVFGTTGLVNFTHAELVTFGAIAAWFFNSTTVGPAFTLPVAGALGVAAAGAFGAGLHYGVWRPLERHRVGLISMMIVAIGLGLGLRHMFAVVFGASPRPFAQYAAQSPWHWGPLVFPPKDLVLIPLAIAVLVAFGLTLERTRLGTAIRAVSDNRDLAESSGIDVQHVVLAVWVLGAALAGLGGIVLATTQGAHWEMGWRVLLVIFAAVILGGLGSPYGPIFGGLVVGFAAEMSTLVIPSEFRIAFALAVLIVVLLLRPQGIMGVRERIG